MGVGFEAKKVCCLPALRYGGLSVMQFALLACCSCSVPFLRPMLSQPAGDACPRLSEARSPHEKVVGGHTAALEQRK